MLPFVGLVRRVAPRRRDQLMDAAGSLESSFQELEKQLAAADSNMEGWPNGYRNPILGPLRANIAARKASLEDLVAQFDLVGLKVDAAIVELPVEDVGKLELSTLAPGYAGGPTVQRVLGGLVILAAGVGKAADDARTKIPAVLAKYYELRTAAAADVVPKILEDVEAYSVAVAKVMLQPGAEAALGGLRQAGKQVPQQVPVDGEPRVATPEVLSKLLADDAAPPSNHPAFALYLRNLATSGSMTL